jgi:acyl carrier protein
MTNKEKISLIEDALEIDENTLTEETLLVDIPEYDSMAKLTLIVLCDDEFDKKLTGEQIKEFKTVKNIIDFMG